MRKFGNVNILNTRERTLENPLFKGKTFFVCFICPNPTLKWRKNANVLRYQHAENQKLIELDLLTKEFFSHFRSERRCVVLAIEIGNDTNTEELFRRAVQMNLGGVYLYRDGKLIRGLD